MLDEGNGDSIERRRAMHRERLIRLIAGGFIIASLALGYWVSAWFYLFTLFVGVNLFQSALTKWCLMDDILRVLFHVKSEVEIARESMKP